MLKSLSDLLNDAVEQTKQIIKLLAIAWNEYEIINFDTIEKLEPHLSKNAKLAGLDFENLFEEALIVDILGPYMKA